MLVARAQGVPEAQDTDEAARTMTHRARPASGRPRPDRRSVIGSIIGVSIIVVAALVVLFLTINGMLIDRLWFESVGQLPVWDLRTFTRLLVWVPISLVVFLLLATSIWLAIGSAGEPAPRHHPHPPVVPGLGSAGRPRPAQRGGDDAGAAAHPR